MAFEVRSIFSLIVSKNLKHIKWFSGLLPERSNSKQPHHSLPKRYSYPAKLLICLLSLNVLLASTYHVVCIELSNEGISKSHLQLYECNYPQNNEPGVTLQYHNQKASHTVLADILGTTPSCPECIDEHIQFVKSSAGIYLYASSLLKTFLPTIQSNKPQFLFAAENSYVPREHGFPLSSFRSSVIRSTILLI
jgi:hypothetical protein